MSSPRSSPGYSPLEPHTFGDAPAALYLVEVLNQRQNPLLSRKVGRVLAENRRLLSEVTRAHLDYDVLSTKALAQLLVLLSSHHPVAVQGIAAKDPHVANLTLNVLQGAVKTWKRRVEHARRQQRQVARLTPSRCSVPIVPAAALEGEITPALLQRRSKAYLARKSKRDTLY